MDEAMNTSKRIKSPRRMAGKVCQSLARISLMPSFIRVRLYRILGVNFENSKTVFIGEDVYFDDSRPDLITVGGWVRITTGSKIFTHFFDAKFIPENNRPFRFYDGKVIIGDYVFIGANVVIAKPVVIGDWAVIGANSVITKDVPPYAIMAGSPARQVGTRKLN
ncbi:MAG: acyltransferase [Gammaproteobacteria bacterium]|nr:acyltransferase [Gammaproteobacteria bacterium]MBU1446711.1 acyltransferase [Gammaproteobacteria bacterium]